MVVLFLAHSAFCALWTTEIVDVGDVGEYSSIATDSNNKVHISYYDNTNYDLKYATNASGSWETYTIDSEGDVGWYTSIAIDSNNKVHISYHDYTNYDLKYATNASGSWETYTIDSEGDVGWWNTSIAIDSNNKVHISYHDNTSYDLKYATNASGSWETYTIDSSGSTGWHTSIAIDSNNKVHISYLYNTRPDALKYATNASGSWEIYSIYSNAGWHTSIATDSNDKVHISYFATVPLGNYYFWDLRYATNVSGDWVTSRIDRVYDVKGLCTSIAIDSYSKVHISYFYDYPNYDLRYATNASGSWETSIIDIEAGRYSSIAIDSNNKVHISYNARAGNLKYATSAPTPVISVSPVSFNFGNVNVGCTSAPQTLTVSNTGLADLVIGTLSITGTDASEFSIQNDNCSGQTIAPSGSCTVDVAFSPTSLDLKSANLSVPSNDPNLPILNVPLRNSAKAMPWIPLLLFDE